MKKRAAEILHSQVKSALIAKSKEEFDKSLAKIAELADLLDQTGDEVSADRLDHLLKQAGFWSALFSGIAGGGGVGIWDAIKEGRFKDSLAVVAKKALMGAATGVVVDYLIQWLDGIPFIGDYLKELEGSDKLRALLESVVAGAVAESDFANKLVDKTIAAVESLFGWGKQHESEKRVVPRVSAQPAPKKPIAEEKPQVGEGASTQTFQVAAPAGATG